MFERQKRQKTDFKKEGQYIEREKSTTEGVSSAWAENEKQMMSEVQVNILPDDEGELLKRKKVMKWDSTKKRYMLKNIDSSGRVIKEKLNESGKKVNNKKKPKESTYEKWSKKTHLKLQNSGEMENSHAVEQARTASEGRKMMK